MATKIPLYLLNKRVSILKPVTTVSASGGSKKSTTIVYTNVPMRINKNMPQNPYMKDVGHEVTSSHIGFCYKELDNGTPIILETGYYIVDGVKEYIINFVDDEPGGELMAHQELHINIRGK